MSPDEQEQINQYVSTHPGYAGMLQEVKELYALLRSAQLLGKDTPDDTALAYYIAQESIKSGRVPDSMERVYAGLKQQIESNFTVQEHYEAIKARMEEIAGRSNPVEEFERLKRIAKDSTSATLKASIPGPFTLSGRLIPNGQYRDRYEITEALVPLIRTELEALVEAGCTEITVDEPSMSCYAYKEDCNRFVDIFNRTVAPVVGKTRLSTHLCFGNFKGHAVGFRKYAPMFPEFLNFDLDEIHVEMASREYGEIEIIQEIAKHKDVAVGVIDVKSYFIETPEHIANMVRKCLEFAPPERLSFAPDCGLSQTARWAAKQKLDNMVAGVEIVRKELGL